MATRQAAVAAGGGVLAGVMANLVSGRTWLLQAQLLGAGPLLPHVIAHVPAFFYHDDTRKLVACCHTLAGTQQVEDKKLRDAPGRRCVQCCAVTWAPCLAARRLAMRFYRQSDSNNSTFTCSLTASDLKCPVTSSIMLCGTPTTHAAMLHSTVDVTWHVNCFQVWHYHFLDALLHRAAVSKSSLGQARSTEEHHSSFTIIQGTFNPRCNGT